MSKTVDELIGVYIEAANAVVWEAEKRGLCPMTLDMQRAGIAAVIRALRDEIVPERMRITRANDTCTRSSLRRYFNEILGDAGTATAGAIQPQGEAQNGFRRSIEGPKGGAASGAFGLERQEYVPLSGEWLDLYREPPTASGNIPGRDSDRLPAPHRHEDGGQQVRAVVGVADGLAGRRLGDSSLNEKVAGESANTVDAQQCQTSTPSSATDLYFEHIRNHYGPPATDPAPAVCEWRDIFMTSEYLAKCGWRQSNIDYRTNCPSCGKPIKFTEAK